MQVIKRKNGDRYKVRIRLNNGVSTTKTFQRKTDALNWERKQQLDKYNKNLMGLPVVAPVGFDKLSERWFDNKVLTYCEKKTQQEYKSILNAHLSPLLGTTRVDLINKTHADALVKKMKEKNRHPKTINKVMMCLKQILSYAAESDLLSKSPLANYKQLKVPQRRDEFFTHKEVEQLLLANQSEEHFTVLFLAVNTGMRLGEILGLCWDRVNFETKQIEVTRSLSRYGLKQTKTNLIRQIPMNDAVLIYLKRMSVARMKLNSPSKYVAVKENCESFNPDHFSGRIFEQALKRAQLRKIRFHDLRHTFASLFMMNGGELYDLQKILGHTKFEMTVRYAHLSKTHLQRAINRVVFGTQVFENVSSTETVGTQMAPAEIEHQKLSLVSSS